MRRDEPTNPTWGSMSTGQKAVLVAFAAAIGATLWFIANADGSAPAESPAYPVGAYAECNDFFDLIDSDLDGTGLMIGVATVAKTAEGGPVEAEAAEVFNAGMSGDQSRSIAAVRAMSAACGR